VSKFFTLFLVSVFFCENNLESWLEKNSSIIQASEIISLEFNMARYNKSNPFKNFKDGETFLFIIDREGRFQLVSDSNVSLFNGDSLINYNKKTNQSFILNYNDKMIERISTIIFSFDKENYTYNMINNLEYSLSFEDGIESKVFFNEKPEIEKIAIVYKNIYLNITNIEIKRYIDKDPFAIEEFYNSEIFDLTK